MSKMKVNRIENTATTAGGLDIDSSGNVGIGTTSPAATTHCAGSFFSTSRSVPSSGVGPELCYDTGDAKSLLLSYNRTSSVYVPISIGGSQIELATGGTERTRIASNGDILIHKTTPGLGVDGLELSNTNGTNVAVTQSGNGVAAFSVNMRYGTGDQYPFYFYYNGGFVGYIKVDSTSVLYSTSSDYRLKENVVPISDAFERLLQLKPSRFNFIVEPDRVVDGFLAHEVQDIVPESIGGEKDGVDADGNPVYQGIDQSKLVPLLTAALQEAIAKIENLEQRLSDAGIA
jgi:hypothetical protein